MEEDEGRRAELWHLQSLVGPSLCSCPGSQRHPVCPAPDQASWPREFVWPVGWGHRASRCAVQGPSCSPCVTSSTLSSHVLGFLCESRNRGPSLLALFRLVD